MKGGGAHSYLKNLASKETPRVPVPIKVGIPIGRLLRVSWTVYEQRPGSEQDVIKPLCQKIRTN